MESVVLPSSPRSPAAFTPTGHRLQPEPSQAEFAMMDRFRVEYLELLDSRLDAIRLCLGDERLEDARVAVLSLESSSGMLGETTMVQRLHDLRIDLDEAPASRRAARLAVIEAEADRVRQRISAIR